VLAPLGPRGGVGGGLCNSRAPNASKSSRVSGVSGEQFIEGGGVVAGLKPGAKAVRGRVARPGAGGERVAVGGVGLDVGLRHPAPGGRGGHGSGVGAAVGL
jgi:hypothetical protein